MKKIQIHKVIFTVFLFAIGFTMLTPLLWMISTSFKPENEVFQFPIKWIPEHSVGLANYKEVWGSAYIIMMTMFSLYGVFLLRQAMMAIPDSLCESAKIDGAGHLRIFFQIIFPLVKPSIATLAVLKFVWTWNDYQTPLIFLSNRKLFTIQLGMKLFASESGSIYSLTMAAAVSATIPLIILFLFGQRYIIDGIASGAVKG